MIIGAVNVIIMLEFQAFAFTLYKSPISLAVLMWIVQCWAIANLGESKAEKEMIRKEV